MSQIIEKIHSATEITFVFNKVFLKKFNTRLQGGADEPLYTPSSFDSTVSDGFKLRVATIFFRCDYISSALHEVSHWSIAGQERRQLEDYGYWYKSDSRNYAEQKEFEAVEIKPQAIELLFHIACGLPFRVSTDNLLLSEYSSEPFLQAVVKQAQRYCDHGIPERAKTFIKALITYRGYSWLNSDEAIKKWLYTKLCHSYSDVTNSLCSFNG